MKRSRGAKKANLGNPKLSPQAWQMIREEAKSLGMTQDEYVRLTGTLFATLRRSLTQKQSVDGKGLLQLVENPLFGAVIQYMASNMSKASDGNGDESKNSEALPNGSSSSTARPTPPPFRPQVNAIPGYPGMRPNTSSPAEAQQPNPPEGSLPIWEYW